MNEGDLPDSLSSAEQALVDLAAKEALRGLRFHMVAGIAAAKRGGVAAATVDVPGGVANGRSQDLLANHPLRNFGPRPGIGARLVALSLAGPLSLVAAVVATVLPRRVETWPLLLLAIMGAAGVVGAMVGASPRDLRRRAVVTAPSARGPLLAAAACAIAALVLTVPQSQRGFNASPGQSPASAQYFPGPSAAPIERSVDNVEIVKFSNRDGVVEVTAQVNGSPAEGTEYLLVAEFQSQYQLVGKLPSSLGTHVVRANTHSVVPGSWVLIVSVGPAAAREWEASTERPLSALPDGTKKLDCRTLT